nr:unnamed protein product [Callosobruchus chinensis]
MRKRSPHCGEIFEPKKFNIPDKIDNIRITHLEYVFLKVRWYPKKTRQDNRGQVKTAEMSSSNILMIWRSVLMLVILGCVMRVVPGVRGETPATYMMGIQFKNKGADRVIVEMTGEGKFALTAGQSTFVILNDTWTGTISAQVATCKADDYEKKFATLW